MTTRESLVFQILTTGRQLEIQLLRSERREFKYLLLSVVSCEKLTLARNIRAFVFAEEGFCIFVSKIFQVNTRKSGTERERIQNMNNVPMELAVHESETLTSQNR